MDKNQLRERAENSANLEHRTVSTSDNPDLNAIIQELRVHQIELEMQNDELKKTVQQLDELKRQAESSRNTFAQLYNNTPGGFIVVNETGMICHCNETALNWFDLTERKIFSRPFVNFISPQDRPLWWIRWKAFMRRPEAKKMELRMLFAGGRECFVELYAKVLNEWFQNHFLCDRNVSEHYYLLSIFDIDDRKNAEEKLMLAASVFEYSTEAIMITDADNSICSVNPAFTRITGYRLDEVAGRDPKFLASGKHDKAFFKDMWDTLNAKSQWQGEIWNRRKNGEFFPEWMTLHAHKDGNGKIFRYVAIFSDITLEKHTQNLLNHQATHDQLTGLPNRALFYDRLQQSLNIAKRNGKAVALLFIDLDGFKSINDTLGHSIGDELLIATADRIRTLFRSSDTFARLGGDEFVVILNDLHTVNETIPIARKILKKLSQPFPTSHGELTISGSIGIALYPKDADDLESLIQYADNAMYAAKKGGRNQFHFFKKEMQQAAEQKYRLEKDLKNAMTHDQLEVYFQPIIELQSREIIGAETLVRWQHPERGMIAPDDFIPIAEECGLIGQLGIVVTEKACYEAEAWLTATKRPLYLTINKSVQQFRMDPNCKQMLDTVNTYRFPLDRIVVEITENMMLMSYRDYMQTLNRLREHGIKIFLDDFGTGYSSLSNLKKLPVDRVKIDRSFIKDVLTDRQDAALVEAIVLMSRKLGLETIAEGIESEDQADYLFSIGCSLGQGYFFGRPVPPYRFLEMIQT
ncbi:MAG: EAL domain-containing protein [Gammaproteobacteria bacterium]